MATRGAAGPKADEILTLFHPLLYNKVHRLLTSRIVRGVSSSTDVFAFSIVIAL
jgi:hypothetical protein